MTSEDYVSKRAELSERLRRLRDQRAANEKRRNAIAFDAEMGEAKAKRELAKLRETAASYDIEIPTVEAALAEARRRVAAGEADALAAKRRHDASQALAMVDEFEARGAALTAKLNAFVSEYQKLTADFRKLDAVGFPPTAHALVAANMRRAVASALSQTDLGPRAVAPAERASFSSVVSGWAAHVRARASAVLKA